MPFTRCANPISVALVFAALTGCVSTSADSESPTRCGRGEQVAAVSSPSTFPGLLDLDGRAANPLATSRPATVVLFARTDCPISNRYAPEVKRLWQVYHPRGVEVFLIYVDPAETPGAIRQHLRDFSYPCGGLRDTRHALVKACGATITPEAAVFDQTGKLCYRGRIDDLYQDFGRARSAATTHELADAIEAVLSGGPVTVERTTAVGCLIVDVEAR